MAELEFHGLVARSVVGGGDGVRLARVRGPLDHEDPLSAIYRALDYFPTPPWAARAGAELIQRIDPGTWRACEPACGEGHMAHGLGDYFAEVEAFDVYPHGYGGLADFLLDPIGQGADWIVTNPPFGLTADFVRLALQRARRGVAILQRTTFFETIGRYPLFYGGQPMAVFSPFAERVPMTLGYWDPEASGQTPYAWYVCRDVRNAAQLRPRQRGDLPNPAQLRQPQDGRGADRQAQRLDRALVEKPAVHSWASFAASTAQRRAQARASRTRPQSAFAATKASPSHP